MGNILQLIEDSRFESSDARVPDSQGQFVHLKRIKKNKNFKNIIK